MISPHVRIIVPGFCGGKLTPGVNTRREHSMMVSYFARSLVELLAFPQVVCMLQYSCYGQSYTLQYRSSVNRVIACLIE